MPDDGSRLDRELEELLQELRVLLTGITVVFAFLLAVPFSNRFAETTDVEQAVYFVAFFATAVTIVLLTVPGVWHRIRFRAHDKEVLLRASNRFTVAGTVTMAVAIDAVVLLIGEFIYDWGAGIIAAGVVGALIVAFWYIVPLTREARDPSR
jgi:hypothetical protein